MLDSLAPIKTDRLKDLFISRFERLILSGEIRIGQKLPSERDLAARLGVSRPVVHEGLLELAAKGLVTMKPRAGAVVNDYRRKGSLALISSLLEYGQGRLDRGILEGILQLRELFETPFARMAAENRSNARLAELKDILWKELSANRSNIDDIVALDFEFHLLIALATGNMIFPLLMNSFKEVYTNLTRQFFENHNVVDEVHRFHEALVTAVSERDAAGAGKVMKEMLAHGESILRKTLERKNAGGLSSVSM